MSLNLDATQINGTPINEEEAACMAMCLATWAVPYMTFKTVEEMNVINIIKSAGPSGQLSAAEIVAHLPTTNPNAAFDLDRMLRLLASSTILTCTQKVGPDGQPLRLYGLGPVCQFFTKSSEYHKLAPYTAYANLVDDHTYMDLWKYAKDRVLNGGIPFKKAHGMELYEYLEKDSRLFKLFHDAQEHHSTINQKFILEKYKGFEGISSLVDVGGATGLTLSMIIEKYPSIKGINYDLPQVIKVARPFPGIEHVAGDMYVSIPKAEAIYMKATFLQGSDEQCIKLLKNCHEALPEEGKVIVCDYVVPDSAETSYRARTAFNLDLLVMLALGSKGRTSQEFENLGKKAGFEVFQFICFASDIGVMEFIKIKSVN